MSRLSGPSLISDIIISEGVNKNKLSSLWGQWFVSLFNALGGTFGVGAYFLNARIDDIHTVASIYIPIPRQSKVTSVLSCLQGTVTGANETLTVKNSSGNTLGVITLINGATAGTVNELDPITNNLIAKNSYIQITTGGLSSTAKAVIITLIMEYT